MRGSFAPILTLKVTVQVRREGRRERRAVPEALEGGEVEWKEGGGG